MTACEIAFWYGVDASGWPEGLRRTWLANLPRLQAQRELQMMPPEHLGSLPLDHLYRLHLVANGDPDAARRFKMEVYRQRLWAKSAAAG